jgi:hypothetical protein
VSAARHDTARLDHSPGCLAHRDEHLGQFRDPLSGTPGIRAGDGERGDGFPGRVPDAGAHGRHPYLNAALDVVLRVRSGIIHITDQGTGDEPMAPFGGVKNSGYGKFGGTAGIEPFTEQRLVIIQT